MIIDDWWVQTKQHLQHNSLMKGSHINVHSWFDTQSQSCERNERTSLALFLTFTLKDIALCNSSCCLYWSSNDPFVTRAQCVVWGTKSWVIILWKSISLNLVCSYLIFSFISSSADCSLSQLHVLLMSHVFSVYSPNSLKGVILVCSYFNNRCLQSFL